MLCSIRVRLSKFVSVTQEIKMVKVAKAAIFNSAQASFLLEGQNAPRLCVSVNVNASASTQTLRCPATLIIRIA